MTHPTTLAEALEMVPVYVLMPYGKKRYMERRPIPQEVREAMAQNLLEMQQETSKLRLQDDPEWLRNVPDDLRPFEWWLLSQGD